MADRPSYRLALPETPLSEAVFSSPHSGRDYPASFLSRSRLGMPELRASEDAFIDEIFASVTGFGAPLIAAVAPRAYVDLNRAPEEMDPAVVSGARASGLNPRIAAGLGVIPRIVAEGRPIYRGKISAADARRRIDGFHRPYHDRLQLLIADAIRRCGRAVLYDCHSMPSDALRAAPRVRGARADIVLGDRFGAAAGRDVLERTRRAFESAGFTVACNAPFAGGHITQRYGRPARGAHAIQIEIDRSLYMDETRIEKHDGFDALCAAIAAIAPALTGVSGGDLLAAE